MYVPFSTEGIALVIAPTLHCPLECRYCYVDRDKAAMDRPTIDALKKFYLKRIERNQGATVCWTGGEPLLVLATVEELNSFFLHEAK